MPRANNPVIAKADCSACGTTVEVKRSLDGQGCAYYYCPSCKHHERWGSGKTKEIFLKEGEHGQQHTSSQPARANEPAAGSNAGAGAASFGQRFTDYLRS